MCDAAHVQIVNVESSREQEEGTILFILPSFQSSRLPLLKIQLQPSKNFKNNSVSEMSHLHP